MTKTKVVVIGNGMVGQRFMENILDLDQDHQSISLVTFCEENRAAYNRVKLTSFFESRNPSDISMTGEYDAHGKTKWYENNNVEIFLNDKVVKIDTKSKTMEGESGRIVDYDIAVLATGSIPFVPPIPGCNRPGVFVYRTIDDLEKMIQYAEENNVQSAAVIGGGLLGLEAAKAVADMKIEPHIIEFAPILMSRQIDQGGHDALVEKIESMGLKVHCNARTSAVMGTDGSTDNDSNAPVNGLSFHNEGWEDLPVQMVVVSAGIKPRDDLARSAGIDVGDRGGVVVNKFMETSAPDIYAIGEVALYDNTIYGLIAPGYHMADVASKNIAKKIIGKNGQYESAPAFDGADFSTKLKLLGCDVASFGINQPESDDSDVSELVWNDRLNGVYRKLIFNKPGTRLRGGILVGDAGDYSKLHSLSMSSTDLQGESPTSLLAPLSAKGLMTESRGNDTFDATSIVCSCNDVSAGTVAAAVTELGTGVTLSSLKKYTRAGTGCGGCETNVKAILNHELSILGQSSTNYLCEHFEYSRSELIATIRCENDLSTVDSFDKILTKYGKGDGCEICKPTVANILASMVNDMILDGGRDSLQDTNDRSLANMQKGGTYSIVPRVPGGELTPDQLIYMGTTAKKYGLYTKITGAQRVDLFGAARHQLPDIWEELGKAGFESGHAYGKALRTVKSCVGSSWCRYGVQDSVSFAIRVENRYKGVRSPHKIKGGVSGCVRECAEAKGKDFGLIATENGYSLYVGGNGGANPVHAQLLASDIDEETAITYLDRYIMYYILTAERLERTAHWQRKLPSGKSGEGPIGHLKDVIIHNSLGLCDELDRRMKNLIDTYQDEWASVVKDPERRRKFNQFVNTDTIIQRDEMIDFVEVRGQLIPNDLPTNEQQQTVWKPPVYDLFANSEKKWIEVGKVVDFPTNAAAAILYGNTQLSVFQNTKRNEWYCTQNMCPHKQAFVLSQGIIGDTNGVPKVSCPLHKKQFSLQSGQEIDGDLTILTFPVKVDADAVFVELPSIEEVDAILGTHGLRAASSCGVNHVQGAQNSTFKK